MKKSKLDIETGEMGKLFSQMPLAHVVREIPFTIRELAKAGITIPALMEAIKARYLLETLQLFNGNWTQAAQLHKVNRATFMNWAADFRRYGIKITTDTVQDAIAADLKLMPASKIEEAMNEIHANESQPESTL